MHLSSGLDLFIYFLVHLGNMQIEEEDDMK